MLSAGFFPHKDILAIAKEYTCYDVRLTPEQIEHFHIPDVAKECKKGKYT